jgi:hypothetical protein
MAKICLCLSVYRLVGVAALSRPRTKSIAGWAYFAKASAFAKAMADESKARGQPAHNKLRSILKNAAR